MISWVVAFPTMLVMMPVGAPGRVSWVIEEK